MSEVNRLIRSGSWNAAWQNLERAFNSAKGSYALLLTAKTAFRIADHTGDTAKLERLIHKILEHQPGNSDLLFLAAYTSARNGNAEKAYRLLSNSDRSNKLTLLKTEAALRTGISELMPEKVSRLMPAINLLGSKDPSDFLDFGRLLGEERFLVNAALLYLTEGKYEKAHELYSEVSNVAGYNELFGYIAYSAGYPQEALRRLERQLWQGSTPEMELFMGDLYLLLGRNTQAESIYQELVDQRRISSATGFINLAWLLIEEGREEEAYSILEQGSGEYPQDERIVMAMAKFNWRSGRKDLAREQLIKFLKKEPGSQDLMAFLLRLNRENLRPPRYLAELQNLANLDPLNKIIREHLCWYLFGLGDYQGVGIVLDTYLQAGGNEQSAWYQSMIALYQALNGEITEAIACLDRSLSIQENSLVRYNHAVLHRFAGNLSVAKEDLRLNGSRQESGYSDPEFQSKNHAMLGDIFLQEGNLDEARRELSYALELDPKNYAAVTNLKMLEKSEYK